MHKNTIMSMEGTTTTTTESTKAAVNHHHTPRLPPELGLIIFRLATSSPITYPPSPPFASEAEYTSD